MGPARRVGVVSAAAGLLIAGAGVAAVAWPAPSPRAAPRPRAEIASTVAANVLPADCTPSPSGPPGSPYELGLVAQIGHPPGTDPTVADGTLVAGSLSVSGIAASLCGVVVVVPGPAGCPVTAEVTVPADGQFFVPLSAVLALVPGQPVAVPFTVSSRAITANLGCSSSVDGLLIQTSAVLAGTTALFGVTCNVGATASLTAVLTGTSLLDLHGTLSGPVTLDGATLAPTCPQAVVTNLDQLAGLPRAGSLMLPVKAALYAPGQAP